MCRKLAVKVPQSYPDGIQDDDTFLGYECGPGGMLVLQFRDGHLVNFVREQFDVDWSKTNTYSYIVRFYRDLISARRNLKGLTPGLEGDQCAMLAVDNVKKLVAFHRWNSANAAQDAIVIANFTDATLNNYGLNFPSAGHWYVQLNSDSTNYGPDYSNIGSPVVTASGSPASGNVTAVTLGL